MRTKVYSLLSTSFQESKCYNEGVETKYPIGEEFSSDWGGIHRRCEGLFEDPSARMRVDEVWFLRAYVTLKTETSLRCSESQSNIGPEWLESKLYHRRGESP